MKKVKYMLLLLIASLLLFKATDVKALSIDLNNNTNEVYINNVFSTDYYADDDSYAFDAESFCEKDNIKKVFRALGWVLTIVKVVIPILLIAFASIDFGKAVIASKDDEMKKALNSLVKRAIAGIIIFLIPTMFNFVIKLIGGEDVYNSTFGPCTECILTPSACEVGD